jgi:hypothetical protein
MYILFLFIVAATLIARIAIEQTREYAMLYAVALGAATFLALMRFVKIGGPLGELSFLFNIVFILLIWWLADRITFDCTVIDDAAKSSGEGLIDSRGLFGGVGSLGARRSGEAPDVTLDGTSGDSAEVADSRSRRSRRRGHQPGRWVLYLALAALPLFGLGQLVLPSGDAVRSAALRSLGLYLFATLTLLVTTSFLGLRRYLRQRGTEMPPQVSLAWLGGGALLIAALLAIAFALPLPGRMIASLELPEWVTSPDDLNPSRYGWGDEGTGQSTPEAARASQGEAGPQQAPGAANQQSGGDQGARTGAASRPGRSGPAGKQGTASSSDGSSSKQSRGSAAGQPNRTSSSGQSNQTQSSSSPSRDPSANSPDRDNQGNSPSGNQNRQGQTGQNSRELARDAAANRASGDRQNSQRANDPAPSSDPNRSSSEPAGANDSANESSSSGEPGTEEANGGESPNQGPDDRSRSERAEGQPAAGRGEQNEAQPRQTPDRSSGRGGKTTGAAESPPSSSPSAPSQSWMPNVGGWLGTLLKLLIAAVLIAIVAIFVIKNRDMLWAWWQNLLGGSEGPLAGGPVREENAVSEPPPPFSSFRHPLEDGSAPDTAVIRTFQAFEAWGREAGVERGAEDTPTEYAGKIRRLLGREQTAANQVIDAYNCIVYGRGQPTKKDLAAVASLWKHMRSHRGAPVSQQASAATAPAPASPPSVR